MIGIFFTDGTSIEVLEKNKTKKLDLTKQWNHIYREALKTGSAYLSQNFGEVEIRITFSVNRLNDVCLLKSLEEVLTIEKGKIKPSLN